MLFRPAPERPALHPTAAAGEVALARAAQAVAALATAALVLTALVAHPIPAGDAGEYLAMAESLWRHGTPEMRPEDVYGLAAAASGMADINFADVRRGYFEDRAGARLSYHFWGYSALGVPVRAMLRLTGARAVRALPLANALLFSAALWAVARARRLCGAERLALTCLLLFSPALWLLLWPHPEVYTFSMVTLALVGLSARKLDAALLAASAAAMQNPPLIVLAGAIWVLILKDRVLAPAPLAARVRALARATLLSLPAVVPMAYFYVHFGTPSVIARQGGAALDVLSLRKALELFFDLDLGLLPYAPIAVLAWAAGVAMCLLRGAVALDLLAAAALLPMALVCTATTNWNHGATGPSRYGVWMVPLVYAALLGWRSRLGGTETRRPLAYVILLTAAVASQAAIVLGRGGPLARPDYLDHSAVARFALRHAPALYNPSPEIFVARTLHVDAPAYLDLSRPVVYRDGQICRKAWARPQDLDALATACGRTPRPDRPVAAGWYYVSF
jgi:hypothetical protein